MNLFITPIRSCVIIFLILPVEGFCLINGTDSLFKKLEAGPDTSVCIRILKEANKLRDSHPDSALAILNQLDPAIVRCKSEKLIARYLNSKGAVLNNLGKFSTALQLLDSAKIIFERLNEIKGVASSTHNMAVSFMRKGELNKALHMFIDAEKNYLRINERAGALSAQIARGALFLEMDNTQMALQIFREAELAAIRYNMSGSLPMIELNIGSIYNMRREYGEATRYYKKVIARAEKEKNSYMALVAYSNVATIYLDQDKFDSAIVIGQKALKIAEQMGDLITQSSVLNNLAVARAGLKNYALAENAASRAILLAEQSGSLRTKLNAMVTLSEVRFGSGNTREAYQLLSRHRILKDSLLAHENRENLAGLQAKFDDYKKEMKISELTSQNTLKGKELALAQTRARYQTIISVSVSVLLLCLLLAFASINKKNRLLRLKNSQIEDSLKEKEILIAEVHHRVKNNLQMILSIFNMQASHLSGEAAEIINENKDRIRSISLIHEKLYVKENLSSIDLNTLFSEIAGSIGNTASLKWQTEIVTTCEDLKLDIDTLIPVGIIVNELVTNCFKYAFDSQGPNRISIGLQKDANAVLHVNVADNGKGFVPGFDVSRCPSFGYRIIKVLCKRLRGEILCTNNNGAHVSIRITNYKLVA